MEATKTSAFLSGILTAITATIVENNDLSFIIVVIVFSSTMIVYVIGFEIWREMRKGEDISSYPAVYPKNAKGRAVFYRAWLRMFIWFLGAVLTAIGLALWSNI
jgi:hypothetical protein